MFLCIVFYAKYYMYWIICIVCYALHCMHCIRCSVLYTLYFMLCIVFYRLHSMCWIIFIVFFVFYSCIVVCVLHALYAQNNNRLYVNPISDAVFNQWFQIGGGAFETHFWQRILTLWLLGPSWSPTPFPPICNSVDILWYISTKENKSN